MLKSTVSFRRAGFVPSLVTALALVAYALAAPAVLGAAGCSGAGSDRPWILAYGDHELYRLDPGKGPRRLVDLGDSKRILEVLVSPDGTQLALRARTMAVSTIPGAAGPSVTEWSTVAVYVGRATGKGLRAMTPDLPSVDEASWSPDGTAIAYTVRTATEPPTSYVVDLTTQAINRLTPECRHWLGPWSCDGKRIAFVRIDASEQAVWTVDRSGQDLVSVAGSYGEVIDLAWRPDGTAIAFTASPKPSGWEETLYLADLVTGTVRVVAQPYWTAFAWSPQSAAGVAGADSGAQGPSLAYADRRQQVIAVAAGDGKSTRVVTSYPGDPVTWLGWSPDGTLLAYRSGAALGTIRPDGTGSRLVDLNHTAVGGFRWSPDGKRIAFESTGGPGDIRPGIYLWPIEDDTVTLLAEGMHIAGWVGP